MRKVTSGNDKYSWYRGFLLIMACILSDIFTFVFSIKGFLISTLIFLIFVSVMYKISKLIERRDCSGKTSLYVLVFLNVLLFVIQQYIK